MILLLSRRDPIGPVLQVLALADMEEQDIGLAFAFVCYRRTSNHFVRLIRRRRRIFRQRRRSLFEFTSLLEQQVRARLKSKTSLGLATSSVPLREYADWELRTDRELSMIYNNHDPWPKCRAVCAAGWCHIFTAGLTVMGLHF